MMHLHVCADHSELFLLECSSYFDEMSINNIIHSFIHSFIHIHLTKTDKTQLCT